MHGSQELIATQLLVKLAVCDSTTLTTQLMLLWQHQ
jgi:hypothetical protein